MRLFSKIFFILSLLSVLYVLSPHPIYAAACSGPGYTCRKFDCAVGEVEDTSRYCTNYDYICCKKVPTSTPKPTNPPVVASPTATPQPTIGGMQCSSSTQCYNAYCAPSLTPTPACSSVCINGHCYTTHPGINPTITDVACRSSNDYGAWSGCMSGQDACGGCASQGYTCQVRYCNDSSSNAYQISCGCSQPPGGGGGGGSNSTYLSLQLLDPNLNIITPPVRLYCPPTPTPSPYRSPTPTPTIRCYGYITPIGPTRIIVTSCPTYPPPTPGPPAPFGGYACYSQNISLCKVRCDITPCISVACEQDVSYANFKGVPANQGASMFDLYLPSLASHLVQ